ncbi:MAG: histidine phosphatase family protein [Candidatus Methylomirabilia bacterium]
MGDTGARGTEARLVEETGINREHAEFHNAYQQGNIENDIRFLKAIYGDRTSLAPGDVTDDFLRELKSLGKRLYFFILGLTDHVTPSSYIKHKFSFLKGSVPGGDPHLFYLAWNGLLGNDSFKCILQKKFSLRRFGDLIVPRTIPPFGARHTRYRTKLVLAVEDLKITGGRHRDTGRILDDGSGNLLQEAIVWLPNGKGMPVYPGAYVPANQTQLITIRHGKSVHESGGDNPEFVGSGVWDTWKDNRRISGSIGNRLKPAGVDTARELGGDFKVMVELMARSGHPLWQTGDGRRVPVVGSESENTEETARCFLEAAGITEMEFTPLYGLNSQKYGALTHKLKGDVTRQMLEVYGPSMKGTDDEKKSASRALFKNRFYHFPEGETLIEADWRIAHSFVDLLRNNLGRRIVLCDHSGALRVFEAAIRTLDFADYSTIKEGQDSIIAMAYQSGYNTRYDYLQKKGLPLRRR